MAVFVIATCKHASCLRIALLGLALAATSCKHYSTVSEKRPTYRCRIPPPAQMIVQALQASGEAARGADRPLHRCRSRRRSRPGKNPDDAQALKDYNFAVGRIFEVIHDSGLEPWKTPLICPGAGGELDLLRRRHDGKPEHDPSQLPHPARRPLSVQGHAGQGTHRQGRPRRAHGHRQQGISIRPSSIPSSRGRTFTTASPRCCSSRAAPASPPTWTRWPPRPSSLAATPIPWPRISPRRSAWRWRS